MFNITAAIIIQQSHELSILLGPCPFLGALVSGVAAEVNFQVIKCPKQAILYSMPTLKRQPTNWLHHNAGNPVFHGGRQHQKRIEYSWSAS